MNLFELRYDYLCRIKQEYHNNMYTDENTDIVDYWLFAHCNLNRMCLELVFFC